MREEILPELIWPCPLEAPHLVRMRLGWALLGLVPGLVQNPSHGVRARRQRRATQQHGADLLAAPVRVVLLHHQDRALGDLREPAARRSAARLVRQPGRAVRLELLLPGVDRVLRNTDQSSEVAGRKATASPSVEQQETLLGGQGRGGLIRLAGQASAPRRLLQARRTQARFIPDRGRLAFEFVFGDNRGCSILGVRDRTRRAGWVAGTRTAGTIGRSEAGGHRSSLRLGDGARLDRFPEMISATVSARISARTTRFSSSKSVNRTGSCHLAGETRSVRSRAVRAQKAPSFRA